MRSMYGKITYEYRMFVIRKKYRMCHTYGRTLLFVYHSRLKCWNVDEMTDVVVNKCQTTSLWVPTTAELTLACNLFHIYLCVLIVQQSTWRSYAYAGCSLDVLCYMLVSNLHACMYRVGTNSHTKCLVVILTAELGKLQQLCIDSPSMWAARLQYKSHCFGQ